MKNRNSNRKMSHLLINALLVLTFAFLSACGTATPTQPPLEKLPTMLPPTAEALVIPTSAPEATAAPTAAPDTSKDGGILRVGLASDLTALDGPNCGWTDWWLAGEAVYNRLYVFDANNQLAPSLATDYPAVSADGLTYTIKLRQGVKFHNGREMTAEDVKFSLDRNFAANVYTCAMGYFSVIEGVKEITALATPPDLVDLKGTRVIDPYTLEIKLTVPTPAFTFALATNGASVVPMQEVKAAGADWGVKTVIGTGPFMLKEWKAGEKIILERNPNYWKAGLPHLDGIDITLNIDIGAAILAFENRELDFVQGPSVEDAKRLLADPKYSGDVRYANAGAQNFLTLWPVGPLADVRVRQAFAMALDREALFQASGGATIVWPQAFPPSVPQADPNYVDQWAYNPEAAKKIVDELYPNGLTLKFWTWDVTTFEIMQADLKKVGITLEIDQRDAGVAQEDWKSGTTNARWGGVAFDYLDGTNWGPTGNLCDPLDKQRWPSEGPCLDKANALINELNTLSLTDPKRTDVLRQLQSYWLNDEVRYVFLGLNRQLDLVAAYMMDMPTSGIYLHPVVENAWIDNTLKDQMTK